MSDITQSDGTQGRIRFTAGSTKADLWMRKTRGEIDIELDYQDAKAFKAAAQAEGFKISGI